MTLRSYYAFEMLYWTGIREGELLALTPADFDFEKQTVRINKTYHRMKKQDIITSPKTAKSNRIVVMPEFLCEEMQDYFQMYYSLALDQRIFPFSKSYLKHEMERGCKATGVPVIRIHDLRHSHVSLGKECCECIAAVSAMDGILEGILQAGMYGRGMAYGFSE